MLQVKMASSAEKVAVLLVFGILIVSNAVNASADDEISENSVGGGLFMHFIVVVFSVVALSELE